MEKMCSAGIVAEYNPYHLGHAYQVRETRAETGAEVIFAVMSGNMTQRGELPVFDKWTRAEMAVRGGVDLVVELPTIYSLSSAGEFAAAGVTILEGLGADWVSFGSESGDLPALQNLADKLKANRTETEAKIQAAVKAGLSWPRARQEALADKLTAEETELLNTPNQILALEYLQAMKSAKPLTVKRKGSGYHDLQRPSDDVPASASFLRAALAAGEQIDQWLPPALAVNRPVALPQEDKLFALLTYRLRTS